MCSKKGKEKAKGCKKGLDRAGIVRDVAYTDNQQNSRSPIVPKLYRVLAPATLLENEPLINVPISQRQIREAEGDGLLKIYLPCPCSLLFTCFVRVSRSHMRWAHLICSLLASNWPAEFSLLELRP